MLAPHTHTEKLDVVASVKDIMHSASTTGIVGALMGIRQRPDSTSLLGTIRVPTLIVGGVEDTFAAPSEAEAMQAAIPGARLVLIPNAAHLPNLEQPEIFNQTIRSFLAQIHPA